MWWAEWLFHAAWPYDYLYCNEPETERLFWERDGHLMWQATELSELHVG